MVPKKQQGGDGSAALFVTFFPQIGYIIMIIMILFFRVSLMDAIIAFGAVMVVGLLLLLFIIALQIEREAGESGW